MTAPPAKYEPSIGWNPGSVAGIRRGSRVRIPAGTPVRSMNPAHPAWRPSGRSQVITVWHTLPGSGRDDGTPASDPMVCRTGSGGY